MDNRKNSEKHSNLPTISGMCEFESYPTDENY